MATRSVSPGGALLRASRVFSVPPPIPQPQGDLSSTAIFSSESATTPYPTHLSITTPQSSLKRGDWGFKRPLPLRSTTKSSTPFIKVKSIDTFEHVTEFGSSADHTLTLQKWLEMGVPLSTPVKSSTDLLSNFKREERPSGKSVFEDSIDTMAPTDGNSRGKDNVRWKFNGPWLAGLNEGEFNAYVLKEVRKRRVEFRTFLRAARATEMTREQQHKATDEGEEPPPAVQASDITDSQLAGYIKVLRKDPTALNKHIRSFLDLPPAPISKASEDFLVDMIRSVGTQKTDQSSSDSPYAETGPPKTHPSAGLSYSRTASHTFNHPLYGPQKFPPPVQARVVMPKKAATGSFQPLLGVGGFTVDPPAGTSTGFKDRDRSSAIPGLEQVDPDVEGGSKTWVYPRHARIDAKGRVVLNVARADPEAIAVKENRPGDIPVTFGGPTDPVRSFKGPASSGPRGMFRPSSYTGGYGLGRKDFSRGSRDERRMERTDVDAMAALTNFVDGHDPAKN